MDPGRLHEDTERIDALCQQPLRRRRARGPLLLLASAAGATDLAPKGRKALLEYSIEIEGKASARTRWRIPALVDAPLARRSGQLIAQQPSVQDP